MDLSSCRPQGKAAQYHLEGEPGRHVTRERLTRLPAELDRPQQVVERPRLGFAGELHGTRGVGEQRGGDGRLGQDATAAQEPVGIYEPLRRLAVCASCARAY